jgi:DNA topoisomerase-1
MAVFGEYAIKESINARFEVNNHVFVARGRRLLKDGWIECYKPYVQTKECFLPSIKKADKVWIKQIIQEDKFTSPPSRYNPSSILKRMENLQIGTKATRANIIQTLYNRKYIKDERITVTELGFNVVKVLNKYVPVLSSVELTQEIEERMAQIQQGTLNRENVIDGVIKKLKPQLEQFKKNESAIGKILSQAVRKVQIQRNVIGKCPVCGTGDLTIIYSRKTKKRFIGCTNYFKGVCETSFPLPQHGKIKASKSKCKACGWPQVLVWSRGKKPWSLCFNLNCSLKTKKRKKI